MADVLNQQDIDAILAAVEEPKPAGGDSPREGVIFRRRAASGAAVDAKSGTPEVRGYDFKRPERVSKDQMRALQTLHESFARNFGASLSGFLRTIVEVKVSNCEQMTYGEFISGLPNPTCFNLLDAKPLEGQVCMELSPLIVYPFIDRLLGGTSQELFIPQRPMTIIETRLISKVTSRGLTTLSEAWAGIKQITFEITASESNPQLVQIVPPNEVVVVVAFEIRMGTRAGTMNLCIPFNVIEPVMEELASQNWFAFTKGRGGDTEERVSGTLSRAGLMVSALLAETQITVRDLAGLVPGDVILTEKEASDPVVLCVEGEKKFLAHLGKFKGMRAMRVVREVRPADRV